MACRADASAGHRTHPAALDPFDTVWCQLFKRSFPHLVLTIGIGVCRCSSRHARSRGGTWLAFLGVIDDMKPIVVGDVGDNEVNRSRFDEFKMRPELINNANMTTM